MFVSCIMPTADRRHLIPLGIASYLAQDWKERELILVDDGAESVWDLVEHVPGIVYLRFADRMRIGRKRNIACEHAAGDIICHFDDDDWSAPERISTQVGALMASKKSITGFRVQNFWDGQKAVQYVGDVNYAAGLSLCYRKDYWKAHLFPDVVFGEDNHLVYRARTAGEVATTEHTQLLVGRIHKSNTCDKQGAFPEMPVSEIPEAFFRALNA